MGLFPLLGPSVPWDLIKWPHVPYPMPLNFTEYTCALRGFIVSRLVGSKLWFPLNLSYHGILWLFSLFLIVLTQMWKFTPSSGSPPSNLKSHLNLVGFTEDLAMWGLWVGKDNRDLHSNNANTSCVFKTFPFFKFIFPSLHWGYSTAASLHILST